MNMQNLNEENNNAYNIIANNAQNANNESISIVPNDEHQINGANENKDIINQNAKNDMKPKNCIVEEFKSNEYNISMNHEINNYIKKQKIGKGSYGTVYLVEDVKSKNNYAAKISLTKNNDDFIQEIHFYSKFQSPLILKLYDYGYSKLEKQPKPTMILEYMPNGSLQNLLDIVRTNKNINQTFKHKKYAILFGIALGIKILHELKIVHCDLKPGNILLDENLYPKICDFGTAIIYSENTKFKKMQEKRIAGSYLYMAPEIFQEEKPYSFKVDVYSFSMIAYEIITGRPPFYERKYNNRMKLVQDVKKNIRPDISMIKDINIQIFLQRCWSNEPTERPDFDEIINILESHTFTSFFEDGKQELYNFLYQIYNRKTETFKKQELNIDDLYNKALFTMNISSSQAEMLEAVKILENAAINGKKEAFLFIADYYLNKKEIPDKEKAAFYYTKAADNGIEEGLLKYGDCLYEQRKNINEAIFYFKKAADLGNAEAIYNIGIIYFEGIGINQNKKEAAKYLKLAADLGNFNAMYQYAIMADDGNGIDVDYREAEKYYKMAILKGDVESMFYYGIMLKNGTIPINYIQSHKYLEMAAKKGHKSSMVHCADTSCIIALFIKKSDKFKYLKKAAFYYKKSADLGDYDASVSYSSLYLRNLLDTNEMEMKVSYLTDAALHGNIDGIILYGFFLIENISKKPYHKNCYIDAYKFFVILGMNGFSLGRINTILNDIRLFSIRLSSKDPNIFYLTPSINLVYDTSNNVNYDKIEKSNEVKNCLKKITDVKFNHYNICTLDNFEIFRKLDVFKNFDASIISEIPNVFHFYFSNFTIKDQILKTIDQKLKKLPLFISVKNNYCFPQDINDDFTLYEFRSMQSISIVQNVVSQIMKKNNIQKNDILSHTEMVYFDESIIPPNHLQLFIKFLEMNKNIVKIQRNVYDKFRIATYIMIKENTKKNVLQDIKNYLLQKDILFSSFKYTLQNNIIINEKMILQNKEDFDAILNEIESIQIKPINVERNKLYMYDDNSYDKLFQMFSFICFKNEVDKMNAVNHINSIVYKNKKNVLHYKTELHYASINEYALPEKVRKVIVKMFSSFKGVEDIQRSVV